MLKVVLVGRPNVGKSTLFNRLVRSQKAIVNDQPGVTRDRKYGQANLVDLNFILIDTAGIDDSLKGSTEIKIREQSQLAPQEERLCSTQVLELFYSDDNWLSCKQISERVPHQEQHVRRVLRKLHAQNLLARRSRPSTNGRPIHIYGHHE